MKVLIGIVVTLFLVFVGIICFAPASTLSYGIEKATNDKLTLAETQGTLWSGSGVLTVKDGDKQYALTPQPMVWEISKLPLLWGEATGQLAFSKTRDIDSVAENKRASFSFSSGKQDIRRLTTPINLPTLLRLVKGIEVFQFGGNLTLNITQWTQQDNKLQANALITWRDARSALSQLDSIGSYNLRISAANNPAANLTLSTINGPLHLDANGKWAPGGEFLIEGDAYADPDYETALQNLLIVAGPEYRGKHHFRFPV